jgi:hypothetical protein
MKLIDADKLKTELDAWARIIRKPNCYSREDALHIIDTAPEIDAVPVVRCRECANAKRIDKNESVYTCTHPQWTRRPHKDTFEESQLFHGLDGNDFCSYGEKMESEGSI